jgi:hypothetical protein
MESEQSQNFNERLSQWVANQGFWFQLRYSISGSGTTGTVMFHLLRLTSRLLIFLLIAGAGYSIYLINLTGSQGYQESFRSALQAGLSAEDVSLNGFTAGRGQFSINRLVGEGGSQTFFSHLEARNVRGKIDLIPIKRRTWDPGTISISKLDIEVHAGADDSETSEMIGQALFRRFPNTHLTNLDVADASIRWGYSERTRGSISNSMLKIQRKDGAMRLSFQGGTFSQNWLRRLDIVSLVITCDADGMTFDRAEFRRGQGTVDFAGLTVAGGERPAVSGTVKIRALNLENILPLALRNFVEGSISGDFQVSGSTNTSEGIGFEGLVKLEDQDIITLRDRIYLFKALSVADYVRNYHRADFRSGSFQVKSGGGGVLLSEISLKTDDSLSLEGGLRVRLPTAEETRIALEQGSAAGGSPLFLGEDSEPDLAESKSEDDSFTLRRASMESRRARVSPNDKGAVLSSFDDLAMSLEMRRLEEQASERLSRTLRYEGMLMITLPSDAFERAEQLARLFPVDPVSGRIPMRVPLEGTIYELTLKQAEEIYQKGAR